MMLSDNDYTLMDDFLKGNLSGDSLHAFNLRLEQDQEFADAFKERTLLVHGIKAAGRNELKKQIRSIAVENFIQPEKKSNFVRNFAVAATFLLLLGTGAWLYWQMENQEFPSLAANINKMSHPASFVTVPSDIHTVNTAANNYFILKSGEKISIPAASFTDENGKPVKKSVKVDYKSYTHPVDQFIAGIPTAVDSGRLTKILKSESVIAFTLVSSQNVRIDPSRPVQVIVPTHDTSITNQVFRLDTLRKIWIACGNDIIINMEKYAKYFSDQDMLIPRLENKTKQRFKILVNEKQFPELASYKNYIFEIAPQEKNFDINDDQLVWKSIVVNKGKAGEPYKVTFQNDVKKVTYQVIPVFSREHYAQALKTYQEKVRKIDSLQFQGEAGKEYMLAKFIQSNFSNTDHQIYRVFTVPSTGIYSNSRLITPADDLSFNVQFVDPEGNILNLDQLAVADFANNTLQRLVPGLKARISIDHPGNKAILGITVNNQLAYITRSEFNKVFREKNINFVKLHILQEPVDYKKLKKLFTREEYALVERFVKGIAAPKKHLLNYKDF